MICPYCKSYNTFSYYKVLQPNILSACPFEQLKFVKTFPFEARLCCNCGLGFNASKLSQKELNDIYDNYLYVSPLNKIGHTAFDGIIAVIQKYSDINDKIIEIGCSEGYILKKLESMGYNNLMGIEPGPQANIAINMGLNIYKGYFEEVKYDLGSVDVFLLVHVLEHFQDPFKIIDRITSILSDSGRIIIEIPNFTGYHHQHLFFFNSTFINHYCQNHSLRIIQETHENSVSRYVIIKNEKTLDKLNSIQNTLSNEIQRAKSIQDDMHNKKDLLKRFFKESLGKRIYWWGAGSLSTILLNQIDIDILEDIDLIVIDGDSQKVGNYLPGINIQVSSFKSIANTKIDRLIIASSYYEEIQDTLREYNIYSTNILIIGE